MQRASKVQMTFVCNQDWDAMPSAANGKFCNKCREEVYDFTNQSVEEVNNLLKMQMANCAEGLLLNK
jgi:hypothetical protein